MSCRSSTLKTIGRILAKRQTFNRIGIQRFYATTPISANLAEEWDVVIVGGGPVGLALASALVSTQPTRESLRIALIEASDLNKVRQWTPDGDTFSNRVSSITNASRQFLDEIGGWAHVEMSRTSPIEEMQVWDGVSDSRITFSASEITSLLQNDSQPGQMAQMTENLNLQRALLRNLAIRKCVNIIDGVKVSEIAQEQGEGGGWPLVHTSDGRILRARLLVGADGFNSPVRSYSGIESYGWAYDTRAIVATLTHPPRAPGFQALNTTAYQRFLPTGPIACLPLSPTVSSLVWSTKPALATAITAAEPAILAAMVNAAFRLPEVSMRYLHSILLDSHTESGDIKAPAVSELLDEIRWREQSHGIEPHSAYFSSSVSDLNSGVPPDDAGALPPLVTSIQPGSIASFPLRLSHADSYIGAAEYRGRTVLIGDAAHTIHPLAGQGLNMGLADAEALASCIHNAASLGSDIGSRTALMPYARARYFENHKLLSATDKLHKLYSLTLEPVVWARSVGLDVINELDSVKAAFMMSAGAGRKQGFFRTGSDTGSGAGWSVAASGVEILAGSIDAAKLVGNGLGGLAASSLSKLLNFSTGGNKR